jgi:hypothetical protein
MSHCLLQVTSGKLTLGFQILCECNETTKDHPSFDSNLGYVAPLHGCTTTLSDSSPNFIKGRTAATVAWNIHLELAKIFISSPKDGATQRHEFHQCHSVDQPTTFRIQD